MQYGLEIGGQWIELGESLKFLQESRKKIRAIEDEIESILREKEDDSAHLEAKISEYRTALKVHQSYSKTLLEKQGGDAAYSKLNNEAFKELIELNRCEEAVTRIFNLRMKSKQSLS